MIDSPYYPGRFFSLPTLFKTEIAKGIKFMNTLVCFNPKEDLGGAEQIELAFRK